MKLPRPHIPLRVRVQVAERQAIERHGAHRRAANMSDSQWLKFLLDFMFPGQQVELHHRPALCNRIIYASEDSVELKYIPDANDPEFLVYVTKEDHHVETRVRGLRGQHSDLGLLRKRKRIERKRNKRKWKWPSRKFPKKRA